MASLLDDATRMLQSGYGDADRLKKIKEALEANKMIVVADRQYLVKLAKDHPENPEEKTSNYGREDHFQHTPDEDLDIDELEEQIRVESEPS